MIIAQDEELIVYIGLGFSVAYDFLNDDNTSIDLADKTASAYLRNIDIEFKDEELESIGTITVEPDSQKGRVLLELTADDTKKLKIPNTEDAPYTLSDIYSKIIVVDEGNKPILDIKVKPIKV